MAKIKDILMDFINVWSDQNQIYSKQCIVSNIDVNKRICTCSPVDGSADILEVRLESDITINSDGDVVNSDPKGFYVVPKLNSLVVVTFLSKTEAFISAYTEISDIITIQDKFTFNDGAFGGFREDNENFYGDYRNNHTKTRWLQRAWWRYLQARWGYSPNIHSWELLNEGDPDVYSLGLSKVGRHQMLADELGKFMHC